MDLTQQLTAKLEQYAKWRHEEAELTAREVESGGGQMATIHHNVPYAQCPGCQEVRELIERGRGG